MQRWDNRKTGLLLAVLGTVGMAVFGGIVLMAAQFGWAIVFGGLAAASGVALLRGLYMIASGRDVRLPSEAEQAAAYKEASWARRCVPLYLIAGGALCGFIVAIVLKQPAKEYGTFIAFGVFPALLLCVFLALHENSSDK
jgi:hypothetical protein